MSDWTEIIVRAKKISQRSEKEYFLEEANIIWYLLCEGAFGLDDIRDGGEFVYISFPLKYSCPESLDGTDWRRQVFFDNFAVYTLSEAITDVFCEDSDLVFQVSLPKLKDKDFDCLVKQKYADALVQLFLKRLQAKVKCLELPVDQIYLGEHLFLKDELMCLFVQKLKEQFSISVLSIDKSNTVTVQYL